MRTGVGGVGVGWEGSVGGKHSHLNLDRWGQFACKMWSRFLLPFSSISYGVSSAFEGYLLKKFALLQE